MIISTTKYAELLAKCKELENIARFFATDARDTVEGEFSVRYIPNRSPARKWFKAEVKAGRIKPYAG